MGLSRAGFQVEGIDIAKQPNYPFHFTRGDALNLGISRLREFDLIWASPPCQAFTAYKRRPKHVRHRANLIPIVRTMLERAGVPFIIENVGGAPLAWDVMLCGSMFGLDVRRHRFFESNFDLGAQPDCHHYRQKPRFAQATNRKNKRCTVEVGVWRIPLAVQQRAMGIDWLPLQSLSQAIPPAYSEWLGKQALAHISEAA